MIPVLKRADLGLKRDLFLICIAYDFWKNRQNAIYRRTIGKNISLSLAIWSNQLFLDLAQQPSLHSFDTTVLSMGSCYITVLLTPSLPFLPHLTFQPHSSLLFSTCDIHWGFHAVLSVWNSPIPITPASSVILWTHQHSSTQLAEWMAVCPSPSPKDNESKSVPPWPQHRIWHLTQHA